MFRNITRRCFTKTSAAVSVAATLGMTAVQADRINGANGRIRLGMIGVGNRGRQLLDGFLQQEDAEIVALCDVYQPYLEQAAERVPNKPDLLGDFREILKRTDIDAVVIATPDHWHAIQTIDACNAGKDVYVEKPLSLTIHEGRKMVEAARRNNRVVQVGLNRRSSDVWQKTAAMVAEGELGHVSSSRAYRLSNMSPDGIGHMPTKAVPKDLNWDLWLGPQAAQPYQDNIAPYKFRWWNNYSSQMGNWGVHYFDVIRWAIGQQAPSSICTMGGIYTVDDDRNIPDTAQALFEFSSGHLLQFSTLEASGNPALLEGEVELRGTDGTLYAGEWGGDRRGIQIIPERGGQFQDRKPRRKPFEYRNPQSYDVQTAAHARNFLDCIKSRELPVADVEIGHRSTTMAHLANISLATKSRLEWDAKKEIITNLPAANEMLHYEYRAPWKLG